MHWWRRGRKLLAIAASFSSAVAQVLF